MKVWVTQPGAGEDAAMKVVLPEDADVSDLLQQCVPLFLFGPRSQKLVATQLQIVAPGTGPLHNRQVLREVVAESDTLVVQPRPQQPRRGSAGTRSLSQPPDRAPARTAAAARRSSSSLGSAPQQATGRARAAAAAPRWAQPVGPALVFGSSRSRFEEPAGDARYNRQRKPPVPRRSSAAPQRPARRSASRVVSASPQHGSPPRPNGGAQRSPHRRPRAEDPTALVREFYTRHRPSFLDSLPRLLAKYQGSEDYLWHLLLENYGLTEHNWRTAAPRPVDQAHEFYEDLLSDHPVRRSPSPQPPAAPAAASSAGRGTAWGGFATAPAPHRGRGLPLEAADRRLSASGSPPRPSPRSGGRLHGAAGPQRQDPAGVAPPSAASSPAAALDGLAHLQQLCAASTPRAAPPAQQLSPPALHVADPHPPLPSPGGRGAARGAAVQLAGAAGRAAPQSPPQQPGRDPWTPLRPSGGRGAALASPQPPGAAGGPAGRQPSPEAAEPHWSEGACEGDFAAEY
eukprot:TRINITY_DN61149_c0_g1_i1.p1 TRINITY_DN61149_c0_g1~~TRINITY_DN61149_c0_g1_i1.p1  ORF type:complete len:513 (+),score=107.03 TRINITY_DN61149_c0_g1_i1:89-1627(+)